MDKTSLDKAHAAMTGITNEQLAVVIDLLQEALTERRRQEDLTHGLSEQELMTTVNEATTILDQCTADFNHKCSELVNAQTNVHVSEQAMFDSRLVHEKTLEALTAFRRKQNFR